MKSIFKKTAIALAVVTILLGGCKNPAEDIKITVNTDIFKSPMLFQFVNAKAGSEGPKDFTVEIKGPNADLVRTPSGGKVFKASDGLLNLMLDRTANPTPNNPVRFTITATAAGFAPTFQHVEVTSATDPMLYKIAMTAYANPAIGNGSLLASKAISNGTANSELTFTTATNTDLDQKAEITIASGTGFLDEAGQPLNGTQLEARIVYTGTATNGKSPVPTGGNIAKNVIGINGQPMAGDLFFYPAGIVTIDMFAGTKEVKGFTKPVNVDMEVNSNMINLNTNQPIQENETIPMWSLNQATGQWKSEGNAKFVKNTAGKLVARMQITHLSVWSTAYVELVSNVAIRSLTCNMNVSVNRPTADISQTFYVSSNFLGNYVVLNKGEKTKTISVSVFSNSSVTVTVQPLLTLSLISMYGVSTNPPPVYGVLTSQTYVSPCNQNITLNYPPPTDGTIKVDMDLQLKCKSKELRTGINAMITVTPQGASSDQTMVFTLVNGKGTGSVVNGVTYNIVVAIDGKSYTTKFTASKLDTPLPTIPDFAGNAIYDKATNTIKIVGLVSKDCN
jgi:hypothetical protein